MRILTEKEKSVLKMFADGKKMYEICGEMGICDKGVYNYTNRIKNKMDVNSLYQAVYKGAKEGVI